MEINLQNFFNQKDSYLIFLDRNRKASWESYEPFIKKSFLPKINYSTISEYKGCDYFIHLEVDNWELDGKEFWEFYNTLDISSVVMRCRVLRFLEQEKARNLIQRCIAYFIRFFKNHHFDKIVAFSVDRYTKDILFSYCRFKKIQIVGIGGSFILNTKRVTNFGEQNFVNSIDQSEVDKIYSRLKLSHEAVGRPDITKARKDACKYYFSLITRYLWYYLVKHKILDMHNYDYILPATQLDSLLYSNFLKPNKFFDYFEDNISEVIEVKNKVYIPLHFYPEATVEYWCDASEKSFYLDSLCEVASFYKDIGIEVYFKEHPAMYLRRPEFFYKRLKRIGNVKIIWPFVDTIELLKYFDKVVVWTGTTGIEAAVNGKNVYLYSKNYWDNGFFKDWKCINEESLVSVNESKLIIKKFLENLIYDTK